MYANVRTFIFVVICGLINFIMPVCYGLERIAVIGLLLIMLQKIQAKGKRP
jgi:hypothetical protein